MATKQSFISDAAGGGAAAAAANGEDDAVSLAFDYVTSARACFFPVDS